MRWGRFLLLATGGLACLVVAAIAMAQTSSGQRWLASAISSLASTPDRRVEISGLSGFVPTDLRVDRIEVADAKGTWVRIEQAHVRWSIAPLLKGELRIDELAASRIDLLRPPQAEETKTRPWSGGGPALPIDIALGSLTIGDLHLAEAMAGVDAHWRLSGATSTTTDRGRLQLAMVRTDGPAAHIDANIRFVLAPFAVDGDISADEPAEAGVMASLIGRPDIGATSLRLHARSDPSGGAIDFVASAGNEMTASGNLDWRHNRGSTAFAARMNVLAPGLPDSFMARLLRRPVAFEADAVLDESRVFNVRQLALRTALGDVAASGQYDIAREKLDATVGIEASTGSAERLQATAKVALRSGGNGRIVVDTPDLAPVSAFAGMSLAGRAHLEVSGRMRGDDVRATWQGALDALALPDVPPELLQSTVRLGGSATLQGGDWQLKSARIANDVLSLQIDGHGHDGAGEIEAALDVPKLEALVEGADGALAASSKLSFDGMRAHGDVQSRGTLRGQPIDLHGRFAFDEAGISVPELRGRWASASIDATDLAMTPTGATGTAHIKIPRLTEFREMAGSGMSGIDATVTGDGSGFDVVLKASGPRQSTSLAARVEPQGKEVAVALSRFDARIDGVPLTLSAPARLKVSGARAMIESATLSLGGGRVNVRGAADLTASDLAVDVAGLPLSILDALAPGTALEGILQSKLHITGPIANPRIEATYAANGLRLRRPELALLPSLSLQGSALAVGDQATFDAHVTVGRTSNLSLKGKVRLPRGPTPLNASVVVRGTLDVAPFAPLVGAGISNLAGTLRPDLSFDIAGDKVTGSGTLALSGAALTVPATGLRLSGGTATLSLQGDALQLERLGFQTASNGEIAASGKVRLAAADGFPLELNVTTKRALLVNRPDLIATVSSTLKIEGSTTKGLDISGPVTVDRAEIGVGTDQAASYPTVAVREINGPAETKRATPPSVPIPVRLALAIQAPRAVFVRGRGLEAEVGGEFKVNGDPAKPSVLGNLSLRHGDLSFAGRRLTFSRGNVSLVNVNAIDPQLDFLATAIVNATTLQITVAGTPRDPKISLTSDPALPQDEAMALLLFGKPASNLSPFELLTAAQAVGDLTGRSPVGSSTLGRVRRGLGLDQLSVDTSGQGGQGPTGQGLGSTSVEAGRYVAPGVYVGAKQGASAGSSRGVVEIEVFKHTKLEGDIGADSNGRVGAKMEWDY